MPCGVRRPVMREDGETYASCADAARALLEEWGIKADSKRVQGIARDIAECLRGRAKTARGYRWYEPDVLPYGELVTRYSELRKLAGDMYRAILDAPIETALLGDIPERARKELEHE